MIEIKAIIRPARLEPLRAILRQMPEFPGMSVVKVEGCSAVTTEHDEPFTIKRELLDYTPKVMIVILARESAVERLCEMIHTVGHTGRVGDGLIWTSRVEGWRRISAPVENGWMV